MIKTGEVKNGTTVCSGCGKLKDLYEINTNHQLCTACLADNRKPAVPDLEKLAQEHTSDNLRMDR